MTSEEPIIIDNVSDFSDGSKSTMFTKMVNQAIKVSHLHILKLLVANFQKIKSTQILIKGEGVLVQMTFTKGWHLNQNKQLWMPLNNFILCIHLILMWSRTRVTRTLSCVINMVMMLLEGESIIQQNTQEVGVEEIKWYSHLHKLFHITRSC